MFNIYFVLSELIKDYQYNCCSLDPPEDYYLAGLVVAKNPSQAKYIIAQTDRQGFDGILEMPKFRCNLRKKDVDLPIGIIKDYEPYPDEWWD